jgi:hypothetical protein
VFVQAYGEIGLGKSAVMEGSVAEPGLIPRALNELFALRRRLGLAMSCCMFEMAGESVRDLLTPTALSAAHIDPRHVRAAAIERHDVHEVLMFHRSHTLSLLHQALRGRTGAHQSRTGTPSSGGRGRDATRRHFVTLVRVERPNQAKRGMLYLVDLSGTEDPEAAEKPDNEFRSSVQTNSDLVCVHVSVHVLCVSLCRCVCMCSMCLCLCVCVGGLYWQWARCSLVAHFVFW